MKQIRERILSAKNGMVFTTSDFADIADADTVRQSLNALLIMEYCAEFLGASLKSLGCI